MSKRYEYKLSQTFDGKTRVSEGVAIGESNQQVIRDLSGNVRDNATSWTMVCKLEAGQ